MMKCYAYVRVSTTRQAEQGASLEAQREAITRYAIQHEITITEWFTESQTAAKRGRAEFNRMMRLLRRGKAEGVVVHKIDRSARNLKDWADFAELADKGVQIHLAAEALDLSSRGGRLSADIQAVVASDFIRGLRQEILKGIGERYRQGILPGRAPMGYRDRGGGKTKKIDPVQGPLVRETFERYATGRYTLRTISRSMRSRGLRNTKGKPVSKNNIAGMLKNPFYAGMLYRSSTGETFEGKHEALVTQALFDRVQDILAGRARRTEARHENCLFRGLFRCGHCGRTLSPELQKGRYYYRCHTRSCVTKTMREDALDHEAAQSLSPMRFRLDEKSVLSKEIVRQLKAQGKIQRETAENVDLQLGAVIGRMGRLTDLLIDGALSQEVYGEKHRALISEKHRLEERLRTLSKMGDFEQRALQTFELAHAASLSYKMANPLEKRDLLETLSSNRRVFGKEVAVKLRKPFRLLAERQSVQIGAPYRDGLRTLTEEFLRAVMEVEGKEGWFRRKKEVEE